MKRITILLLLVLCVGWTHATIYFVSPTGSGTDGLSWATAYTSPAAALAGSPVAGDEVWVKQGTYVSASTLSWKTGINFYGGFTGTETLRNQRSTDASLTILEGTNTNRVLNAPSMASPTTWDGFTIQKGTAATGSGAFLQKNAILQNCIIQNNTALNNTTPYVAAGGGIYIQGDNVDSIKVLNCTIKNNIVKTIITTAASGYSYCGGGGIFIKAGSFKAVVRGCAIESNTTDGLGTTNAIVSGGGVFLCDGILENTIVKNNIVTNKNPSNSTILNSGKCQGGGALIMPQTTTNSIIVRNCHFTGNIAEISVGGGISIDPLWGNGNLIAAHVYITNTKILNNWAYKNGGGIMTDGQNATSTSNYNFTNCLIANNESSTVAAGGAGSFVNNVANYVGTVSFNNCTVVNNKMLTTNYGGSGIFYNNIKADISNCIFWGNGSVGTLAPYHVRLKTTLTTNKMTNCIFDSRFVESQVSPVATPADLTGKVIVDLNNSGSVQGTLYPYFVNPTNFIGKVVNANDQTSLDAANWSTAYNSAAINTGATIASITTDITGLARPQGSAYDIGAYELRAYDIAATSNNETMGSVSGTGAKLSGSSVTLTATSNNDYHFVNWTEGANVVSTNSSYTFTSGANRTLVANFEANTHSVGTGIVNASDVPCSTCDVTIAAGAELKINSTKTLKSITVAPGAKLTVNANQTLTATNGITLQSDENGTGSFVDLTTSNPQSITATVQQHVTAGRNWYMSIPFATAPATFFNKGTSVVCFDEPSGEWVAPVEGTLNKMRGYIQTAKSSPEITGTTGNIELSGVLNTGAHSINLTRTEGKTGFNLVGNPYPSYLDWNLVTKNNVSNTMWLRTKEGAEYKFYTYVANEGSGIGSPASVTNLIPPMQAFWVRVNTVAGGSIAVENTMRAHKDVTGNILKAPKSESQKILRLQVNNGINSDETVIYFNPKASDNLDQYDAPKRSNSNPSIPEIFTQIGNETLVINGMNEIKYNTEIPIGFRTGQSNNFNLSINEFSNFENGTKIILKDKMNPSNEIELNESTSYNFTSDISTNNTDRFSLTFKSPDFTTDFSQVKEISSVRLFVDSDNKITIISPDTFNYSILNTFGQEIQSGRSDIRNITITGLTVSGIYVVKISDDKGNKYTSKVIIK